MKVEMEAKDCYGQDCFIFRHTTSVQKIQDYLWENFQGYKFAIIFDEQRTEYEEMDSPCVYFMDGILHEMVSYVGTDYMNDWFKRNYGLKLVKEENNETD